MALKRFIGSAILIALLLVFGKDAKNLGAMSKIGTAPFDPATVLLFNKQASIWEEALPVGNGRLGAMVYGYHNEEKIQLLVHIKTISLNLKQKKERPIV